MSASTVTLLIALSLISPNLLHSKPCLKALFTRAARHATPTCRPPGPPLPSAGRSAAALHCRGQGTHERPGNVGQRVRKRTSESDINSKLFPQHSETLLFGMNYVPSAVHAGQPTIPRRLLATRTGRCSRIPHRKHAKSPNVPSPPSCSINANFCGAGHFRRDSTSRHHPPPARRQARVTAQSCGR